MTNPNKTTVLTGESSKQISLIQFVQQRMMQQNAQSVSGSKTAIGGDCMYRSPDGMQCAIGCMIPDEMYDPIFEQWSIGQLCDIDTDCSERMSLARDKFAVVLDHIMDKFGLTDRSSTIELIFDVQFVHDDADHYIESIGDYSTIFYGQYQNLMEKYV